MILEIISAVIAVAGTLFITFKMKTGFLLWVVGDILWLIYGAVTQQYFFMGQYIVFTVLAAFGFIKWFKDDVLEKNKHKEVKNGKNSKARR